MGEGAISWFSSMQGTVAAAGTTEAEYVALSDVVKEVLFLRQIREFMVPKLNYPITIMQDNEGVIKLANNKHASCRTRHIYIDAKHHIVRDAIEKGKIRVIYVETQEQHADILTKPLDLKTFAEHTGVLMNAKL